jgi:hypothetical protein
VKLKGLGAKTNWLAINRRRKVTLTLEMWTICVVRHSSASKNVRMEVEECWGSSLGNDWWRQSRLRNHNTCCRKLQRGWIKDSAIVICSYKL